ncbi:MAG: shikimate dehydrogenase [Bacteroidetes bacterium CG_4_10_14_3_um_filter_31_20]|nr:MAG: shikimate dehydrogenase [Bacteroidetes bacterium CG_4_8_14_3_um_filter_31_14]PIY07192.1 MAG: shikimate dehydrogenase [Bacteroidetes bacterium CG_4_10_14_3_um_filter_31_20]
MKIIIFVKAKILYLSLKKKMYGLIGKKLGHSFSEKIFKEKFAEKFQFKLIELESIDKLKDFITNHPTLKGFSVTIPYKKEIIPYINILDDVSKRVKAVNTVLIKRTNNSVLLYGYNTDAYGFTKAYKKLFPTNCKNALIIGTGGAANAVKYALNIQGINVIMVSRKKKNDDIILFSELSDNIITNNKIIINATPLGMFPNVNLFPDINYKAITNQHLTIDLTYNPVETMFMKKAKEYGAKTINGYNMLQQQAEKAWKIYGLT